MSVCSCQVQASITIGTFCVVQLLFWEYLGFIFQHFSWCFCVVATTPLLTVIREQNRPYCLTLVSKIDEVGFDLTGSPLLFE